MYISKLTFSDKTQIKTENQINHLNDDVSLFDNQNFSEDTDFLYENDKDWEPIQPKANKFLWIKTEGYTYTTADGTKISVDSIEDVEIYQNTQTGEISIIGAKDAKITGTNKNEKLNIYDSTISTIDAKGGNDKIYIENSKINKIVGGAGNDSITIQNSEITDCISAKKAMILYI